MKTIVRDETGGYLVRISLGQDQGTVIFSFSSIEHFRTDQIDCVLRGEFFPFMGESMHMTLRVNILSASAREGFIRSFAKFTDGDKVLIERAFIQAIEMVKEDLDSVDESAWVESFKSEQAEMLFSPFLVKGAPSILFGKGGGAKTYIALRLALSLASKMPFMGFTPKESCKTLFVDYEDVAGTAKSRIEQLWAAEPALTSVETDKQIRYLPAKGVPFIDLLPRIKKIVIENDIRLIIVDSAVSACGGEPEKADVVAKYFNALASIGVASLTIAHETKSENHAYPFGSVFWYNFPRSIWNVRSQREDTDNVVVASNSIETGLFHRKANNGPIQPAVPLKITFHNIEGTEQLEKVTIERGDSSSWEDELSASSRVKSLLEKGPKTRSELADLMADVKSNTLEETLRRLRSKGVVELLGTKGSPYILAKKSSPHSPKNEVIF